ncbi:MAG: DMT family transporter [Elusimicrobiota bacterium]|jgi:drug/metabolite transporter (DMT)-like permease
MKLGTLLGLVVCNLIWSANPTMAKFVMKSVSPAHAVWLRYASALAAYALAVPLLRAFYGGRRFAGPMFVRGGSGPDRAWILALGLLTFVLSPLLQMSGLSVSRAVDGALVVAMEPLIAVLFAAVLLREPLGPRHLLGFALALTGFSLLSGLTPQRMLTGFDAHAFGNLLLLLSLAGEGAYSAVGRKLVSRHPPGALFASALLIGVLVLTAVIFLRSGPPPFSALGTSGVLAVLWLGPLGTAFGYLYWMAALREAPVASVALTLFIQPVMGTVWGRIFLDERLTLVQGAGALLILLSLASEVLFDRASVRDAAPTV